MEKFIYVFGLIIGIIFEMVNKLTQILKKVWGKATPPSPTTLPEMELNHKLYELDRLAELEIRLALLEEEMYDESYEYDQVYEWDDSEFYPYGITVNGSPYVKGVEDQDLGIHFDGLPFEEKDLPLGRERKLRSRNKWGNGENRVHCSRRNRGRKVKTFRDYN